MDKYGDVYFLLLPMGLSRYTSQAPDWTGEKDSAMSAFEVSADKTGSVLGVKQAKCTPITATEM